MEVVLTLQEQIRKQGNVLLSSYAVEIGTEGHCLGIYGKRANLVNVLKLSSQQLKKVIFCEL